METTEVTITIVVEHDEWQKVTAADVAGWLTDSLPDPWFDADDGEDLYFSAIKWETT